MRCRCQGPLEYGEFLIDLDANCLKYTLCGMSSLGAHLLGHRTVNHCDEFARRLDGVLPALLLDEGGNALCPALLAIGVKNLCQLVCRVLIDNRTGTSC